ncbi:hypothetical protein K402DRAFT_228078 [Aulographum hederae CBS 113979]|uniref:Uncharacterized protein n=1 Tax=Aulographum hederae CBS 113979 TaxID=1176131 RepID=A0A6G1HBG1_9PEZI|nr:hypothetical protein K402DRAFT_228078 [Aulographum hederae CBS 113979]
MRSAGETDVVREPSLAVRAPPAARTTPQTSRKSSIKLFWSRGASFEWFRHLFPAPDTRIRVGSPQRPCRKPYVSSRLTGSDAPGMASRDCSGTKSCTPCGPGMMGRDGL